MASTARSNRGRPRKLVYPPPLEPKTNAAGALVVEALPGEGSAELRLDRGTLCVEEVEKAFVVRRDRTVDVCTSSNQSGPMGLFRKRDFLPVHRPARCA